MGAGGSWGRPARVVPYHSAPVSRCVACSCTSGRWVVRACGDLRVSSDGRQLALQMGHGHCCARGLRRHGESFILIGPMTATPTVVVLFLQSVHQKVLSALRSVSFQGESFDFWVRLRYGRRCRIPPWRHHIRSSFLICQSVVAANLMARKVEA